MPAPTSESLLKEFTLFEGVKPAALAQHGLHAAPRSLGVGENLIVAGEPRTKVWFIRSGWVRVIVHSAGGHETTAAIAGPGEILGCAAYFGLAIAPCTVTAMSGVEAVSVPAIAFERWLKTDALAACRLIAILGRRLSESGSLKAINAERAPLRVRLTLGWLARKFGSEIPATRAMLADLTGLRAETCSRVLSDLRRRGVLTVSPGRIRVLRREDLDEAPARPN